MLTQVFPQRYGDPCVSVYGVLMKHPFLLCSPGTALEPHAKHALEGARASEVEDVFAEWMRTWSFPLLVTSLVLLPLIPDDEQR